MQTRQARETKHPLSHDALPPVWNRCGNFPFAFITSKIMQVEGDGQANKSQTSLVLK